MLILKSLYLMLPAYFANMAPVLFRKLKFLNIPVDFNEKIEGKPVFGRNKTYRGFLFGVLFALVIAFIQFLLSRTDLFNQLSILDYSRWYIIGVLLGLGALTGDLAGSFIKRRLNIAPGKPFIPLDQLDYSIGALIFISFIQIIEIKVMFIIIVLSFLLHIIATRIGFYLRIRKEKF